VIVVIPVQDPSCDRPKDAPFDFAVATLGAALPNYCRVCLARPRYWLTCFPPQRRPRPRRFRDAGKPPETQAEEKPRSRYEGYDDEGDRPPETGIKE